MIGILFTDIEGSVAKWELFPEQMAAAFARHHQMIDAVVAAHRGHIHDRAGDGVLAQFGDGNPLACALELQKVFREADWSDVGGMALRISVHAHQGDQDGLLQQAINRAARMVGAAWGGQIVVSAFAAAAFAAPEEARLTDLGSVHLRDIAAPVQLLCLTGKAWSDETFPPLRGVSRQTPNMPLQAPIFGRQRELVDLSSWVSSGQRVVSIVAPGGMGKTRLAIELARSTSAQRQVCFAALPPGQTNSDQLAAAINTALRLAQPTGVSAQDALLDYLRERDILIVLDNADGVSDEARLIDTLIQTCPQVSLVTTGRAVMLWRGEAVYRLGGLVASSQSGDFRASAAAMLFAQAARSYDAQFAFELADEASFEAICEAVRGAPLALQLIAQWLSIMPLAEIAENLRDGSAKFTDLDNGSRALRDVFDGSWVLLDDEQRASLASLSVFPEDFDQAAAQNVAGVSAKMILGLERMSLLERRAHQRIALHPLTREFAHEKLIPEARREALLAQHAHYFLQDFQHLKPAILGSDLPRLSERMRLELSNQRAAWRWMAQTSEAPSQTLRAAEDTFYFYVIGGLFGEALRIFEVNPRERALCAAFLAYRGNCLCHLARLEEAKDACREALALANRDEAGVRAHAHQGLANILHHGAAWEEAIGHYHTALELRAGDPLGRAYTTLSLAWLELQRGDLVAATAWRGQSEALCVSLGFSLGLFMARHCEGDIEARRGDHARALAAYRSALMLEGALGHTAAIGNVYTQMGDAQRRLGDESGARTSLQSALDLAKQSGAQRLRVRAWSGLASLPDRLPDERRAMFLQALAGCVATRNAQDASRVLLEAARFEAGEGNLADAGEMFVAARDLNAGPWKEYEAELVKANADLTPARGGADIWRRIEAIATRVRLG